MSETKEIIYKLEAYYDDELVFSSDYPDTTMLQEELGKAEVAIQRALEKDQDLEEDIDG